MADDNALLKAQSSLTVRDWVLLHWLYDHGVLTTEQIANALFPSLDFAQRRVLRLLRHGVLARFRPQRWEGGSYPYHYVLDQLGVDAVTAQRGLEPTPRTQARRRREHLTSKANLPHLLGTNQFFTDLAGHARRNPGTALERWWPAAAFHNPYAFHRSENDSRDLYFLRSQPRPDGHGVWAEDGRRVPFLAEIDLATETHGVLAEKVQAYERLALMITWRWPVLFWFPTHAREQHFQRMFTDAPLRMPIATAAAKTTTAAGKSPADDVWLLAGKQQHGRLRLADLPVTDTDLNELPIHPPQPERKNGRVIA